MRIVLLIVAVVLFVLAAVPQTGQWHTPLLAVGLAVFAAAHIV